MNDRSVFPPTHSATPLVVSFYGAGAALIGEALFDFFNTVPLFGHRTELCRIMTEWKSDKGTWHNYTMLYHFLLRHRRFEVKHVFELGVGTIFNDIPSSMGADGSPGASLRAWREYFPNAAIAGADIDKRILFSEERISTFYVDQRDAQSIHDMWSAIGPQQFDIIIDDGLHLFEANSCFFLNSYQRLEKWGYYFIEDINISDDNIRKFDKFFSNLDMPGVLLRIPDARYKPDNCFAIFRR